MSFFNTRIKRTVFGVLSAFVLLYLVLLIPTSTYPEPGEGEKEPFAWNQDDYFQWLESRFSNAMTMEAEKLKEQIDGRLSKIEQGLISLASDSYDPGDEIFMSIETELFELAALAAAQPERIPEFIEVYRAVRNAVKEQSRRWDMNSIDARNRIYRLLYGGRAALEEIMLQSPPDSYPPLILSSREPSVTPSAEILGVTIHSGDILVSRGGAPTSALIARGNDYPGNFSHAALAYVDEASGDVFIIESHIEIGVTCSTIDDYLGDRKLRVMILRLRSDLPQLAENPMLPHRAAAAAYDRARSEHIPYDFEMDYHDHRKLFCSEVVFAPYEKLGITLWSGISNISSPGLRSWLAAFGVRHFETQEPSDLEYDPQLAVVAEWRDPETLYKDHLDNAVIDVMLQSAEQGEKLAYDWYMLPVARVIKAYCVLLNEFGGAGPIPEGMSPEAALRNTRFSKTHIKIKRRTSELARQFQAENGYQPPYWELVKLAEKARDLEG